LWVRQALAAERVEPLAPSPEVAVEAALLGPGFAGDPVDRIIFATAAQFGARLVSRDARMSAYDPARVTW
jgi:PIN domain nuclease of toxin-antitoxin system